MRIDKSVLNVALKTIFTLNGEPWIKARNDDETEMKFEYFWKASTFSEMKISWTLRKGESNLNFKYSLLFRLRHIAWSLNLLKFPNDIR